MPITIIDAQFSTILLIIVILILLIISTHTVKNKESEILSHSKTGELKGVSILAIIFAHIGYVLVSDSHFLYPLTTFAGVGVDIFLFLSGYGLTLSMMRSPLSIRAFYQKRLIKICIPFWLVLCSIIIADIVFLGKHYETGYLIRSFFGWFPSADVWRDINSPFWYMTWILGLYLLFPIFFYAKKVWVTALILAIIANLITWINPLDIQAIWLHELHTNSFSLGIFFAGFLSKKSLSIETTLKHIRTWNIGWKFFIFSIFFISIFWIATHGDVLNGSLLDNIIGEIGGSSKIIFQQILSFLMLSILLCIFIFKTTQNRFLALFGTYSYELYLIHWPLLSRYDIFFHSLPAWIATIIWLIVLVGFSYILQNISKKIG